MVALFVSKGFMKRLLQNNFAWYVMEQVFLFFRLRFISLKFWFYSSVILLRNTGFILAMETYRLGACIKMNELPRYSRNRLNKILLKDALRNTSKLENFFRMVRMDLVLDSALAERPVWGNRCVRIKNRIYFKKI